jgi:drug/metabolite transporter (DMT)-like permease
VRQATDRTGAATAAPLSAGAYRRMRGSSAGVAIAIAAWSLSPLLIYESRGLADAPILALYAVAIGSFSTLLVLSCTRSYGPIALCRAAVRGQWFRESSMIGLGAFVAYPLLYFTAIQSGPPAAVNLVNYLWPIVAILVVSLFRPGARSLELVLAAGFGFAGAAVAITAGVDVNVISRAELHPYLLAALGALVYGGASGAIRIRHTVEREDSFALFAVALLFAGLVAAILILMLSVAQPELVALDLEAHGPWALLAYAALLPLAHLSWMTAIRDSRVPAFSAAFLVPVLSTGILTAVVAGTAEPEILSALVLVLCGIAFSSVRDKGVPVGYAVGLALLSSIQVSQILADNKESILDVATGTLSEVIAAITAIFAGFVLSNAIQRSGALHGACSRFYAKAAAVARANPQHPVVDELDRMDATVLHGVPDAGAEPRGRQIVQDQLASEWADVDVAVGNGVSSYEWLVLLVGGASLIVSLHAYAVDTGSAVLILLRAFAVALVVGILFAVRDYDRHRPQRLSGLLVSFRGRYGFPLSPGSPLAESQSYWARPIATPIRLGLALLVVVAVAAVVVNG